MGFVQSVHITQAFNIWSLYFAYNFLFIYNYRILKVTSMMVIFSTSHLGTHFQYKKNFCNSFFSNLFYYIYWHDILCLLNLVI